MITNFQNISNIKSIQVILHSISFIQDILIYALYKLLLEYSLRYQYNLIDFNISKLQILKSYMISQDQVNMIATRFLYLFQQLQIKNIKLILQNVL
ncbi:hypothetical protein pb186bvf_008411 [Paramecium bursaria]